MPKASEPIVEPAMEAERFELQEPPLYHFSPDRRDFLKLVAGGILFGSLGIRTDAQSAPPTLDGRVHIGRDGSITVLTGKIEEGQGARTELAMAAAEELCVPIEALDVVMADTAMTPDDGITAGSRTTPSTVPSMRRSCALARQLLIATAARAWKADASSLTVRNGFVQGGKERFGYRDLAGVPDFAQALKQLPKDAPLRPVKEWEVFGRAQTRVNGEDLVRGVHKFPSDIQRDGTLYGSVLRSPSMGAKLVSVDAEVLKGREGVTLVRDGAFVGCVAPSSFEARQAVEALAASAKWEEKPGQPSNSTLWDYLKGHTQGEGRGSRTTGDVNAALANAKGKLQATYTAAYIAHAPMEPRAAVAEWQDGKVTVWTGTSNPFSVRNDLAQAFGIPAASVRVIVPDFGGGFGGKHTGEAALEAARLAREVKRPVSLRWTRAEEFTWAYARPAALIEVQAALDDSKKIAAWDFTNYNSGPSAIDTPYKTLNARIRYLPVESPLRQGSYRALASTANNFARECMVDELAQAAGLDPLAFRLEHLDNERIRTVLIAAADKFGWKQRVVARRPNRGVGLACGIEKNSVVAACVEVELDSKGSVRLLEICEAYECGAILNPAGLRAQVEGCIVMGLGAVLGEEMRFADGRLQNVKFSAYRVPRFRDVPPKVDLVFVDKKDADPVGAGETPIIAVAPAMANAVYAISGQRVRSLPFPPIPTRNTSDQ
jgi:CO/xanthine dehydrogenase Mo-binding subunit